MAAVIGQLLLDVARDEQTLTVIVTHSQELAERIPRRLELIDGRLEPVSA